MIRAHRNLSLHTVLCYHSLKSPEQRPILRLWRYPSGNTARIPHIADIIELCTKRKPTLTCSRLAVVKPNLKLQSGGGSPNNDS